MDVTTQVTRLNSKDTKMAPSVVSIVVGDVVFVTVLMDILKLLVEKSQRKGFWHRFAVTF
jgi:hypothetical protein